MKEKTVKIYSVIPLKESQGKREKIIAASEKEDYLNCKFWKKNEEEAKLFFLYYAYPMLSDRSTAIILILSGGLLKNKNSLEKTFLDRVRALFERLYYSINDSEKDKIKADEQFKNVIHLLPIIEEVINELESANNRVSQIDENNMIDDILDWAEARLSHQNKNFKTKAIFEKDTIRNARKRVKSTRAALFKNKFELNQENFQIIKPLLESRSIYYQDAKTLFFPEHALLDELIKAAENQELIARYSKTDKNICYFEPRSLIKWLMRHDYITEWLTYELIDLKKESLEEAQINRLPQFDSIEKLSKEIHRDDILQAGQQSKYPIYLLYPKDTEIYWHESVTTTCKDLPKARYLGLGQLKSFEDEETHYCITGVTLESLLRKSEYIDDGKPNSQLKATIEFVPTEEEAKYGLQPYIRISRSELPKLINDKNLIAMQDTASKLIYQKQKRSHALHEKIKELYKNSSDKSPKAIWKELKKLAESGDDIIQEVTDWTVTEAKIFWRSHTGKENNPMDKRTFENCISKLNTGKT